MYGQQHYKPAQTVPSGMRSPPPLQHPRPQHPPSQIPSHSPPPPASASSSSGGGGGGSQYGFTSGAAASNYQRFASPPSFQQQPYQHPGAGSYGVHQTTTYGGGGGGPATPDAYIPANANANPYAPGPSAANVAWNGGAPTGPKGHPGPQRGQPQNAGWPAAAAGPGADAINSFGAAMGMNDATAQIGVQFGKQALTAGQAYIDSHFTRLLPLAHLKHSFNVSNSYVINKIRLVLFPWRHRPWSRSVVRNESTGVAEGWKPPRDDLNCPDLYVPVMALVTYILLSGVAAGKAGTFDPRILGQSSSRAFGILLLEFVCIRLGCYLLGIGEEGTVVDLVSYEGYKFVGVIVVLVAGLVGATGWSFWLVFTYVVLANFFFQLRSLRHLVLPDPSMSPLDHVDPTNAAMQTGSSSPSSHAQRARRIQFLFVIAAAQGLSMGILVRV